MEMGPVEFSEQSNQLTKGRHLKISDESQQALAEALAQGGYPHITEPFDAGEVSFHAGWLYHRAGANTSGRMRKAMTVIYMDSEMKLKEPENEDQVVDRKVWCPGVEVGRVIASEINPVLFERAVRG